MLNWPHLEDRVLLSILLIDTALLLILLFKILNKARTPTTSRYSRHTYSSICTCLLTFFIIGTFTLIFLQDLHTLDDDPLPPLEADLST